MTVPRNFQEEIDLSALSSRTCWERWALIPFEVGFCLYAVYTGLSGIFWFGTSSKVFNEGVFHADIFNWVFVLSGIITLFGSGFRNRIEILGLVMLATGLLTRILVTVATVGWSQGSHNLLALSVIGVLASCIRAFMLIKRPHIQISLNQSS